MIKLLAWRGNIITNNTLSCADYRKIANRGSNCVLFLEMPNKIFTNDSLSISYSHLNLSRNKRPDGQSSRNRNRNKRPDDQTSRNRNRNKRPDGQSSRNKRPDGQSNRNLRPDGQRNRKPKRPDGQSRYILFLNPTAAKARNKHI